MANLVNLESISKSFGVRQLLDGVSLGVGEGDRIGVVGLNGGGKTTLLEILAGLEPPDSGRVSHNRDLNFAVVTQRSELPKGSTIRQNVIEPLGFDAEHEWAADAKVRSVLDGLGLSYLGLDTVIDPLSGGERRRVALAAALVRELDLIILDEPTNHLDVEGVQWLADHLGSRRCGLVVVTHDRWFLDTVCTKTWEVVGGGVEQYEGGYADWIFARAERSRLAAVVEEKRQNLARKELAWLRRGAPARTSKPQYRIEAAEALIADVPPLRDSVELISFSKRRLGKTVIDLEDATLRIPDHEVDGKAVPGRTLLDNTTWLVGPGDRVGLVGVNGSGKTTLLRALAGERELEGGARKQGQTVRLAHLTQELLDLPKHMRVLEAVEDVARRVVLGKYELSASQLAERMGFPAARQWTPVGDLSGGERRRLQLTRLLMSEPNVLLLDEPTNDLDIDTLQQLEDLLDSWPGTMIVVSHDRYLVERVCDNVVALFGDRQISRLVGGIEEYLDRRAAMRAAGTASAVGSGTITPAAPAKAKVGGGDQRAARKELSRLERKLAQLDSKGAKIEEKLAAAGADVSKLVELDTALRAINAEKAEVEEQWMLAAEMV